MTIDVSRNDPFDVVVVGGGHAGCEAALAAARLGARTLLVSLRLDKLAAMPCNPSIGGIAKSHLVFEIDALGGEMARNADFAGLQFRVLNTRRGAAVRANRVQCDKYLYKGRMRLVLEHAPDLTLVEDEAVALLLRGDRVAGVALRRAGEVPAARVVLTAGTFLRGTIHVGHETTPGGGNGQPPSRRFLPPGVTPRTLTGELPVAEGINARLVGDPWFKYCDTALIDVFAEAMHKVARNIDRLRGLEPRREGYAYWSRRRA